MNPKEFQAIFSSIKAAAARYPNCRTAGCDCNSKANYWNRGCSCLCHFLTMDIIHGKDCWSFDQFEKQVKKGYTPKE